LFVALDSLYLAKSRRRAMGSDAMDMASIAPCGNGLSYLLHHNKSLLISFILIFDKKRGNSIM
jgi:hypothetical protein